MTTTPSGAALPRGIRNNNPGNLRHGDDWQGRADRQPDTDFLTFTDPVYGLRALMKVLLAYRAKHGIRTVGAAIRRWAPPSENDTATYAVAVARRLGVAVDAALDWTDPALLTGMARAIVTHENGRAPAGWPADWYDAETYLRAAGLALGRSVQHP